ncbi:cytochrome P450 [Pseudofrankia sp. BMG5.37]|uniref:cytochrome P450 n=1 Tax=Pseudofrankia sp. BMG5.37 TaxID=3050035 RepID=UPI002895A916|nr:cytochrome P450 [Pseudofrankia sp. BMG5.37]MDT3442583.1 cytochrome P450 [Pseudofrankia sp. BMG5.37]
MRMTAQVSDLDPFAPEVLSDPYPTYKRLREAGPVVWLERYGVWATARDSVVRAALLDHETFISSAGTGLADLRLSPGPGAPGSDGDPTPRSRSLLQQSDPPEHTRARHVVGSVLAPAALRALRETWAVAADELVGGLVGIGEIDGIRQLAQALPLRVFADAVGLPREGRTENVPPFVEMAFNAFGPPNELAVRSRSGGLTAAPWIVEHCLPENLSPDGWGAQIHRAAQQDGFSRDEATALVRSLLVAGMDTTVKGLGATLWFLAAHPEQYARLSASPSLARAAFDESVRLESPIQLFFRCVSRDVDLAEVRLCTDDRILLLFGAANRDPRRWDDPDRFDLGRAAGGHLGFGAGIHACVGRAIAYMQAEAVLTALVRHAASLELAGRARWRPNNALRGLAELPLRLSPRR